MNLRIRQLTLGLIVVYAVLFVQLNVVQLLRADELRSHPANTRDIVRQFGEPRGEIMTSDGKVVARSVEVEGDRDLLREYPQQDLYAHITGYLSLNFGAAGLERTLNDELAGATTEIEIKSFSDLFVERNRTADVTLTINHEVQRLARAALGDRKGSVVALDPRTGEILALWSWPSFDPNLFSTHDQDAAADARMELLADDNKPLLARSYQERFAPGSTFKAVTAAAALEAGAVTPTDPLFEVVAEYIAPQTDRAITNFGGAACGGDLTEMLRVSCNTGFAKLGVDIGADRLAIIARAFGFNSAIPIDLPDPAESVFPRASFFKDNIALLAQSAIGQFDTAATPLQMAMVAAAIANDGVMMTPYVVATVTDSDGQLIEETTPSVQGTPMGVETARQLGEMLESVVEAGTASSLQLPGVRIAGKTGTAELGDSEATHAWIIGFAPVEAPRVAFAVIVEGDDSTGELTGGAVAGPIAVEVLRTALEVTDRG